MWCVLGFLLQMHAVYECKDLWIHQNALVLFHTSYLHYNNNVHKHYSCKRASFSWSERARTMRCFTCQMEEGLYSYLKNNMTVFFLAWLRTNRHEEYKVLQMLEKSQSFLSFMETLTFDHDKKVKRLITDTGLLFSVTCSLFEFNPQPSSFPDPNHVTGAQRSLPGFGLDKKAL